MPLFQLREGSVFPEPQEEQSCHHGARRFCPLESAQRHSGTSLWTAHSCLLYNIHAHICLARGYKKKVPVAEIISTDTV